MRVLIACEFSGTVREAFAKRGHDAVSCDLIDTEIPGNHYKGSVLDILPYGWDLIIAHPPCTYLTVTGNKWLKDQPARKSGALVGADRRAAMQEGIDFFMLFANANADRICIENPVGVMSSVWRKPDQIIQPYEFGHPEPKKTRLWLKGLQPLKPTKIVDPEYTMSKSGKQMATWYYLSPLRGKERQQMRNKTFQGIADAMAEQWG